MKVPQKIIENVLFFFVKFSCLHLRRQPTYSRQKPIIIIIINMIIIKTEITDANYPQIVLQVLVFQDDNWGHLL